MSAVSSPTSPGSMSANTFADGDTTISTEIIEKDLPVLLLQYLYHLNDDGNKVAIVGIDSRNFCACVIIYSTVTKRSVYLPTFEWSFIPISYASVYSYLKHEAEYSPWCSSHNFTLKPMQTRQNVRLVRLINNQMRGNRITLTMNEWQRLGELNNYFSQLLVKFEENAPKIEEYYHAYIHNCHVMQKKRLTTADYFVPFFDGVPTFNHFRLFHEIPIVCREKMTNELRNLITVKNYLTVGVEKNTVRTV